MPELTWALIPTVLVVLFVIWIIARLVRR